MVKKLKIGKLTIMFVFRHKFEKENDDILYRIMQPKGEYKLGIWYKTYQTVSNTNVRNPKKWHENLSKNRMLGFDLILCKFWFEIDYNAAHFG